MVAAFLSLFIYLLLAVLGLHCFAQAFSSHCEQGLLFVVCGKALGCMSSVAMAHRLGCSVACEIFPD